MFRSGVSRFQAENDHPVAAYAGKSMVTAITDPLQRALKRFFRIKVDRTTYARNRDPTQSG
jgi:hypothetical protein